MQVFTFLLSLRRRVIAEYLFLSINSVHLIMRQCSDFDFLNYLSPQCLTFSRDLLERKVEISSLLMLFPGHA